VYYKWLVFKTKDQLKHPCLCPSPGPSRHHINSPTYQLENGDRSQVGCEKPGRVQERGAMGRDMFSLLIMALAKPPATRFLSFFPQYTK
jgi:hypothetical protein